MEEPTVSNHAVDGVHSLSLRDFVAVVFRHRRLVAICFLGILCGSILVALLQPNRYDAAMKILVKRERVDPVVTPNTSALPQFAPEVTEEQINSELELLKGKDLLEKVVVACDLLHRQSEPVWYREMTAKFTRRGSDSLDKDAKIARAVRALERDLQLVVVKKTDLIAVNYESPDPVLAARVLTTLAGLYLEKHLAVHRPPGAFNFFQ